MIDTKQVESIFTDALERPPQERVAFLAQACGANGILLSRVRRLLDCYRESDDPLERPAIFSHEFESTDEDLTGCRIGPYRLIKGVATGGMGTVWLAERADEHFRKQVAVKLIKRGMDTDEILLRFRTERQVLANLEHPHIARLLDGGATDDGRPYLVMEYVDGIPIERFCDEKRMPISERLRLFQRVCAAVQFAHQNLVVHRDLKPSNILIEMDGTPKLLDFGIAKLLRIGDEPSATGTAGPLQMMTPEYASPEQVVGEAVTTATDVYSLGVLLYQLLTGHSPYDVPTRSRPDYERAIRNQEPRRPSTVVFQPNQSVAPETLSEARGGPPRMLQRILSGDIDTIVLKALHKEPGRRYASVEQLSEDIRRYLAGLPVLARPDSRSYRAAKFIHRNKIVVAGVVLVFLSLVGGIVGTTWQARKATAARLEAEEKAKTSQRVTEFLVNVFGGSDPDEARGRTVTARELLDAGAKRVKAELTDDPLVQATLMDKIGFVYQKLGQLDSADSLIQDALAIRRRRLGPDHADIAASLHHLAANMGEKDKFEEAEKLERESLAMRRRLFGSNSPETAESLNTLGIIIHQTGRLDEVEPLYEESNELHRRIYPAGHPLRLNALNQLAVLYYDRHRFDEAEKMWRESLEARRKIYTEPHQDLAMNLNNLAMALQRQGRLIEAVPLIREALGINRKLFGENHKLVATNLSNLGRVELQAGNLAEAEEYQRQALAGFKAVFGETHANACVVRLDLAAVLKARNKFEEAERLYREVVSIGESNPEGPIRQRVLAAVELSLLLEKKARFDEAESLLLRTAEAVENVQSKGPGVTEPVVRRLIEFYESSTREREAAVWRSRLPTSAPAN